MTSLLSLGAAAWAGLFGLLVVALGLCTVLLRRSLVVVTMGLCLGLLGVVVILGALAAARADATAAATAMVLLTGCAALAPLGAAIAIAVFRRRGTLNVDELRELRG